MNVALELLAAAAAAVALSKVVGMEAMAEEEEGVEV